jgi:hypothetical protein
MDRLYRDGTLSVTGQKMTQFEGGLELGALVHLLDARPSRVSWQDRAIIQRTLGYIRANDGRSVRIYLIGTEFVLLARALTLVTGLMQPIEKVFYRGLNFEKPANRFVKVLDDYFDSAAIKMNSSLTECLGSEMVGIVVLTSGELELLQEAAELIETNVRLFVICRDLAKNKKPYPHESLRRSGASIIESADGFCEFMRM